MEDPAQWDRLTAALYHSAGPDEEVWQFLSHTGLVGPQRERDRAKYSRIRARVGAREPVPGPSMAYEVAAELRVGGLATAEARLPDPYGAWAKKAWQRWRKRALRRRTFARWAHPLRRPWRFAAALGQPGFESRNVRYEMEGQVRHGPVRGEAHCDGHDGVVALLAQGKLGWVVPARKGCAGWFKGDWISAWSTSGDELMIEYWLPPEPARLAAPFPVESTARGAQYLGLTAHPTDIDEFLARASRVLPQRAA